MYDHVLLHFYFKVHRQFAIYSWNKFSKSCSFLAEMTVVQKKFSLDTALSIASVVQNGKTHVLNKSV